MWRRPLRAAVRAALADPRLRSVIESELKRRRQGPGRQDGSIPPEFVDGRGVHHPLDPALRDRLKSGWRVMVDPEAAARPPSDDVLRDRARKAERVVAEASALVTATAGEPLAGRILEVGCYDGAMAFQLARRPGTQVVASDLARYYAVQRPQMTDAVDLGDLQTFLGAIRARAGGIAGLAPGMVTFVEDDITATDLEAGAFDAIVSFEVLEHVKQPDAAFAGMATLLRPGGILYHDYNPFFSAIGGHSLCTLDFPWGHARLGAEDFERYLREIRPDEVEQALRFYRESLNRMTLGDLRASIDRAGLELLQITPWLERGLAMRLDPDVLADVQRAYPGVVLDDLLATFVSVIARRPSEPASA